MQLTGESIKEFNEADLRKLVIVPLLRAMGFHDVRELHGTTELGKDIVMWKPDEIRDRTNLAVVAKAVRITGGRVANEVIGQIRQALGSDYEDPVSLRQQIVNRVIVITSWDITPGARKALKAQLVDRANSLVDLWDGEALLERVRRHLPRTLIWDGLDRARKALHDSSDHFDYTLQVGPTGSRLFIAERRGSETSIEGKMSLLFPATPEGEVKRQAYQRFLEEGAPIELNEENITRFEIPDVLRALVGSGEIHEVRLGPTLIEEPTIKELVALDGEGNVLCSIDYVEFTHIYGGSKRGSMDNSGQPIPFHVQVILNKDDSGGSLKFALRKDATVNVLRYYQWLLWMWHVPRAATVVLRDWHTGLVELSIDASRGTVESPTPEYLEVIRKLVALQERTGTRLDLGPGERVSPPDVRDLDTAYAAVMTGFAELPASRIRFEADDPAVLKSRLGEEVRFCISQKEFNVSVLGVEIRLGPVEIFCRGSLRISEEDQSPSFLVDATPDEPFMAKFLDWSQVREVFDNSDTGSPRDAP